jgi:hypothetical protein
MHLPNLAACRKTLFFDKLHAVQGCTAIFNGCKPSKMGAFRKPRFSIGDGEKAMNGFFTNLLADPSSLICDSMLIPCTSTNPKSESIRLTDS